MDQIDKLSHNTLLQSVALPSVTNDQKVFAITISPIKNYLKL